MNTKENQNPLKKLMRLRDVSGRLLAKKINISPQRVGHRIKHLHFTTDELPIMAKLLKVSEQNLLRVIRNDKEVFSEII